MHRLVKQLIRSTRGSAISITEAQLGVWIAHSLSPGIEYSGGQYLDIRGEFDRALLRRAIEHVVLHEAEAMSMRVVEMDGVVLQRPALDTPVPFETIDLTQVADPMAAADEWMWEQIRLGAEIGDAPLYGYAILEIDADRALLFTRINHVIVDGYGGSLITKRIADVYHALAVGDSVPARALGDLAELVANEAGYLQSPEFEEDQRYWRARLATRPAPFTFSGGDAAVAQNVLRQRIDVSADASHGLLLWQTRLAYRRRPCFCRGWQDSFPQFQDGASRPWGWVSTHDSIQIRSPRPACLQTRCPCGSSAPQTCRFVISPQLCPVS